MLCYLDNIYLHFAASLSAPDDDCDILLLPVYSFPFLLFVFPVLPVTTMMGKLNTNYCKV